MPGWEDDCAGSGEWKCMYSSKEPKWEDERGRGEWDSSWEDEGGERGMGVKVGG